MIPSCSTLVKDGMLCARLKKAAEARVMERRDACSKDRPQLQSSRTLQHPPLPSSTRPLRRENHCRRSYPISPRSQQDISYSENMTDTIISHDAERCRFEPRVAGKHNRGRLEICRIHQEREGQDVRAPCYSPNQFGVMRNRCEGYMLINRLRGRPIATEFLTLPDRVRPSSLSSPEESP